MLLFPLLEMTIGNALVGWKLGSMPSGWSLYIVRKKTARKTSRKLIRFDVLGTKIILNHEIIVRRFLSFSNYEMRKIIELILRACLLGGQFGNLEQKHALNFTKISLSVIHTQLYWRRANKDLAITISKIMCVCHTVCSTVNKISERLWPTPEEIINYEVILLL